MDPEFLKKLVTEDELIKAFDGKVLDDILKTSNAYNKPFEDLCPENTIALEAQIERIEQSSPGFEDLEPSENTAQPNGARAHIGKSNSEGAQIRKSTTPEDVIETMSSDSSDESSLDEDVERHLLFFDHRFPRKLLEHPPNQEEWESMIAKDCAAGKWKWIQDCSKPIYCSDQVQTLEWPLTIKIGDMIPLLYQGTDVDNFADRAIYLARTSEQYWSRLNYNKEPHPKFTPYDALHRRDNKWLKTQIFESRFVFPTKAIVGHVVKEFNERVEFGENYGKNPAAKPTVKNPYKKRSSKKSTKVNTVEEEEDRLMTPPRKKKSKTLSLIHI